MKRCSPFSGARLLLMICSLLLTLHSSTALAQSLEAQLSVLSLAPARLKVEGSVKTPTRVWSFRNSYAGLTGLGERIENLTLADEKGASVAVRKLAAGEYETQTAAARFSYEVKLDAPARANDAAYASWLTAECGLLLPGDLLPIVAEKGKGFASHLKFSLPPAWAIYADEREKKLGEFEVIETERAVFFAGRDLRSKHKRAGGIDFALVTGGAWAFADEDLLDLACKILSEHAKATGTVARGHAMLMLSPFPQPVSANFWSAETRGTTVIFLSGRSPSSVAALAQLPVPLSHELFHLWIPNAIGLSGNYDWFYEGFTQYQALRVAQRLEWLTFQDYLAALARAFDAYAVIAERDKFSLIEASQRRWMSAPSLVYNKGLLVAWLYDLSLRQQTGGKRSLDDVYRELFRQRAAENQDGNTAILYAMNRAAEMKEFTKRFIESAGEIDLQSALMAFGLRAEQFGGRTRIVVSDALSREQRALLRGLGYNESARR